MPGEGFCGSAPLECLPRPAVQGRGDRDELVDAPAGQVGAFGEVLAEQAVDASMSSGELVAGDVVLPGCLIGGHGLVDNVNEVALEDAAGAATALGGLVAGQ